MGYSIAQIAVPTLAQREIVIVSGRDGDIVFEETLQNPIT